MRFKLFALSFLFILNFAGCKTMDSVYMKEIYTESSICAAKENVFSEKRRLAYIRGTWPLSNDNYWQAEQIRGELLTDLNISFALINRDGKVELSNKQYLKREVTKLHEYYPNLRVNISIGGWGADGFSVASANPDNRKVFVDSAVALVKEFNFDGVDIDWEFPVGPEWGQEIVSDAHDKQGYILLLSDLRKAFNLLEEETGKYYTVTTAVPSAYWFTQKNDVKIASIICDYINLMCYDYYGSWSENTGYNASLYLNSADPSQWSTEIGLKRYLNAGVAPEKIVLGIPFYAFGWKGVTESGMNGRFQKPKAFIGNMDYVELQQKYGKTLQNCWDDEAKCSYFYDANKQIFITYTSPRSIQEIAAFAKKNGLGGLMYWEYANDMDAILLEALARCE